MSNRACMKPEGSDNEQLSAEIEAAGLPRSEPGGAGRFYAIERFALTLVIDVAPDLTQEEEDTLRAVVAAHVPGGGA